MKCGLTNIYGNFAERLLRRMLRRAGDTPERREYVVRRLAEKLDVAAIAPPSRGRPNGPHGRTDEA